MVRRIIIDPRGTHSYFTYYLLGLYKNIGKKCISYDQKPFMSLHYDTRKQWNAGTPFILEEGDTQKKVFVDMEDVAIVFEDRYTWCDVYGKVNPTDEQLRNYPKMIALGPQFGVCLTPIVKSVLDASIRFYKIDMANGMPIRFLNYLKGYLYPNIRRCYLSEYEREVLIRENYIFHASTLWYNEFAKTDTNAYRGAFLQACQELGMEIEGGLYYIHGQAVLDEMPDYPKYLEIYKDFIYDKRLSMKEYIHKTKQSIVVFNTPSVCGCHGWKLGEYLCMGKAIVSTPLTRAMPGQGLVHGENVHFVYDIGDIKDAVRYICDHPEYRKKLEEGARRYYEEWIAPEVAISRLINC